MKLKRIAPFFTLLLPLALLSACGGTAELDLHANWYVDETNHQLIKQETETLTYDVTYEPGKAADPFAAFEYETGTYTTILQERASLAGEADWATGTGYIYETHLTISGSYKIVGGEKTSFTDTIDSRVSFASVGEMLRPIKSEKIFHTTSQTESRGTTLVTYDYSYTATYNEKLSETEIKIKDLRENVSEEDKLDFEKKMKLKGSGTFLDNEQILLALRAIDVSAGFSFRTVNPVTRERVSVTLVSAAKQGSYSGTFVRNGVEQDETALQTSTFAIGYTSKKSGMTQALVYASPSEKKYRNALLEMQTTSPDGNGTFTYRLKKLETFDQ